MLQNKFSIRLFQLTKWSFLVHSTMCNAPYIHPSHDSIIELWRTFSNGVTGRRILSHILLKSPGILSGLIGSIATGQFTK